MKPQITLIMLCLLMINTFAQAPQKMSYQAVVRTTDGELVKDHAVGMKVSILQGSPTGTMVFQELYNPNPQTNANGLVSIEIGTGTPLTGTFSGIDWSSGPFYLKTETDPSGGTNYTISGTSQLLSVPFALHAQTVEEDRVNDADADETNELQTISLSGNDLTLSDGGGTVTLPSGGSSLWTESGSDVYRSSGKVGIGTSTPEFKISLESDGGIIAKGEFGSGTTLSTSGEGTRLIWYPQKGAFRAGFVLSDKWNDANIGDFSFASGADTKASGSSSFAFGQQTLASGNVSTSMGLYTKAESYVSTAFGVGNVGGGSPDSWVGIDPLFEIGNSLDNQNPSNALTILKNGQIGIGIHSPSQQLDIDNGNILIRGTDGFISNGHTAQIYIGGTYNYIKGEYGYGLKLGAYSAADALNIREITGNVGIGTTNPLQSLHVYRNTNPRILVEAPVGQAPELNLQRGTVTHALYINENSDLTFYRAGDRVTFTDDGNVGIGIKNPVAKLDVNGKINVNDNSINNVADPVNAQDAATKAYIDDLLKNILALLPNNFDGIISDIQGNRYKTVKTGNQVWMAENLRTAKYKDNTDIPLVTDRVEWLNLETPGYCWYNNDKATYGNTYGALYNWWTVNTGKLCPTGWHVPSNAEWTTLITYLGGEGVAGGKMKEAGTALWESPNTGATNESGFSALPGSYRAHDGNFGGTFETIGDGCFWWSSSSSIEYPASQAWHCYINYNSAAVIRNTVSKIGGKSIRCLKD